MEVGLVYSSKDPRQAKTRDFVVNFLNERGVLANVVECDSPVDVPRITINGCEVAAKPRKTGKRMSVLYFPSMDDITKALERGIWCV
ncbi:MAG TPA: hypothetical protein PLF13_02365 [candidate division Zixibacteria bacterium]|nr:hypothetical protein [candidate division Zixibacteria bacterium]